MKKIAYFCVKMTPEREQILTEEKIKYKATNFSINPNDPQYHMSFRVTTKDQCWPRIRENFTDKYYPMYFIEFEQNELDEAEWLTFRSKNMKLNSMNWNTFRYTCPKSDDTNIRYSYHEDQLSPFEFSSVKWSNNNHFYSSYEGGFHIIFCDDYACDIINKNGLVGVRFDGVLKYKKNVYLPNVHQMVYPNVLPLESMVLDEAKKEISCPYCGKKKYVINREFRLKIKREFIDESLDFYDTIKMFNMDETGSVHSIPIISKHAYSVLKSHNLIRNLVFEPVILL